MFNLTQKAAKHFKVPYSSLDGRNGNFWRLDIVYVNHRKILMCVHEPTLYTALFNGIEFKTIDEIAQALGDLYPWCKTEISMGKGKDRHVGGSMTDMKLAMKYYSNRTLEEVEKEINQTPYSYLDYGNPELELQKFLLR